MAIALRCLNINCGITGPHQSLFVMLPSSLVSFSFTACSFLVLKSAQNHFAILCSMSTPAAAAVFDELCHCILHNPCLCCFNHRKQTILRTDFSSHGFSYIVCQPDDNNASLQLVDQYMSGNGFGFMTSTSKCTLYPVAFGSR
jgi:hypothetical protein